MKRADRNDPEGFDTYWTLWRPIKRRNDGRGDARKAYLKQILAGVDPQDIIDGAKAYIRKLPSNYEYVPLAATWINREVFADYAEEEREYQARLSEAKRRPANDAPVIRQKLPATHFLNRYKQGA